MKRLWPYLLLVYGLSSCNPTDPDITVQPGMPVDTLVADSTIADSPLRPFAETLIYDYPEIARINTGSIRPEDVVLFAQTLKGVPYQYASCSPEAGFDCSGFVYYVFHHFNIPVPRSSRDFTKLGKEVSQADARPGDLILFTGTDNSIRTVGHMGIVVTNSADSLQFIHSSSGQANGVTMTTLNPYYQGRFMKVIRVFQQNRTAFR